MIFTQSSFVIFALIVIPLYYITRPNKLLNRYILLISSYIFYGWADWHFAVLLFISSCCDFWFALKIHNAKNIKKSNKMLIVGLSLNLALLIYFKYYILLASTTNSIINKELFPIYSIALPAGISFYTFQSMSYIIDVYRKNLKPTESLSTYLLFVSFFPQLVAGPIERATHLLPQFYDKRPLNPMLIYDGARQILAGIIMKVVIADNLSPAVDLVYGAPQNYDGTALLFATVFFSFQIYCDFAGYSNIAIGLGKLMGFDIMQNFRTPYFAHSLPDFWRRWHISLSTFFRDYVYHPLGGSRVSYILNIRNILIVFAISGIWHGANWTFLAWGIYHGLGLALVVTFLNFHFLGHIRERHPRVSLAVAAVLTQIFVLIGWVYFRSTSMKDANYIIERIIDIPSYTLSNINLITSNYRAIFALLIFIFIEFIQRNKSHIMQFDEFGYLTQAFIYSAGIMTIFLVGAGAQAQFIYFRF